MATSPSNRPDNATPVAHAAPLIVGPPPRTSSPQNTWRQDLQQGIEYVRFVWIVASRVRGLQNQARFLVGIILWKPMLPREKLDYEEVE